MNCKQNVKIPCTNAIGNSAFPALGTLGCETYFTRIHPTTQTMMFLIETLSYPLTKNCLPTKLGNGNCTISYKCIN